MHCSFLGGAGSPGMADILLFGALRTFISKECSKWPSVCRWAASMSRLPSIAASSAKVDLDAPAHQDPPVTTGLPGMTRPSRVSGVQQQQQQQQQNRQEPSNQVQGVPADVAELAAKRQAKVEKKAAKKAGKKSKSEKAIPPKGGAAASSASSDTGSEVPALMMMDIRVGTIVKAWEHPDSDHLWCEEIDVGEEKPWQIASGLREHYSLEEMQGANVLVVCNLKPAKYVIRRQGPSHVGISSISRII